VRLQRAACTIKRWADRSRFVGASLLGPTFFPSYPNRISLHPAPDRGKIRALWQPSGARHDSTPVPKSEGRLSRPFLLDHSPRRARLAPYLASAARSSWFAHPPPEFDQGAGRGGHRIGVGAGVTGGGPGLASGRCYCVWLALPESMRSAARGGQPWTDDANALSRTNDFTHRRIF
jgi:hypothetical protein